MLVNHDVEYNFKVEYIEKYAEMPLYWLEAEFSDNGEMTATFDTGVESTAYKLSGMVRTRTHRWTQGLMEFNNNTIQEYTIKDMDGGDYMFIQWKSGDYTVRHEKPCYYVFKKVSGMIDVVGESVNVTD